MLIIIIINPILSLYPTSKGFQLGFGLIEKFINDCRNYSNYHFAFTTLSDWIKISCQFFNQWEAKPSQVAVILVLVFRHSIENCPKDVKPNKTELVDLDEIQLKADFK